MRVLFAGNKERGRVCLEALVEAGHTVVGVLAHPPERASGGLAEEAGSLGVEVFEPDDVNDPEIGDALAAVAPDVLVLAGYGQILGEFLLGIAPHGAVNLHGGKLPRYRGSSPMNWALIEGEKQITLSALLVDTGVDTGDVVGERTFTVSLEDTIADVQERANALFPELLVETLAHLAEGTLERRPPDEAEAQYWPLRFPEDGLVVWDLASAREVHNRIRALTHPYAGAFTYWDGRQVTLLRSSLEERVVRGEPGRVYAVGDQGLLVCAADRCLRVTHAVLEDGSDALAAVSRYDTFATAARRLSPQP